MALPCTSLDVRDCGELFAELARLETQWVFRGQSVVDDPESSLRRCVDAFPDFSESENGLLWEFQRGAVQHLAAPAVPQNRVEWWTLMQHHGAPTRLVDFTDSPYVAAYFAMEEPPTGRDTGGKASEKATIWAFHRLECYRRMGRRWHESGVLAAMATGENSPSNPLAEKQVVAGCYLSAYPEAVLDSGIPGVLLLKPRCVTERLAAQQGVLLCPLRVELSFADNVADLGDTDRWVKRILVPRSERGRILERLRAFNIQRASLFPGIDGYAASFKYTLAREALDEYRKRLEIEAFRRVLAPDSRRDAAQSGGSDEC